ncbi:hypothetical protein PMAYCL1PPCAC_04666, partial [Pristionchus mayeri]
VQAFIRQMPIVIHYAYFFSYIHELHCLILIFLRDDRKKFFIRDLSVFVRIRLVQHFLQFSLVRIHPLRAHQRSQLLKIESSISVLVVEGEYLSELGQISLGELDRRICIGFDGGECHEKYTDTGEFHRS